MDRQTNLETRVSDIEYRAYGADSQPEKGDVNRSRKLADESKDTIKYEDRSLQSKSQAEFSFIINLLLALFHITKKAITTALQTKEPSLINPETYLAASKILRGITHSSLSF
jgi:hypothetical protein